MSRIPRPLFGSSPLAATAERLFAASRAELYAAWTTAFDSWFAQAGTLSLVADEGKAWFFYNREDWGRHPHYGRFLSLEPERSIETTWLTGNGALEGTCGAETVLKIELEPSKNGTLLKLRHFGFVSEASRDAHAENWPLALEELASALAE